jgi:hypothetical protein
LFICDLAYYMPRVDSIFLDNTGAIKLVQGVPSDNPIAPSDLATAIRLYDILLPPYTFTVKSFNIKKFNYRRYTMADIADIDTRVERLQDLVTLSILEQSALNMQVRDAVTGLSRFKNGIVVDRFADHGQGAVGQEQYRNSVDPLLTHLRAAHYTEQVELIEQNQTNLQRQGDGYRKTGPLMTVDYSSVSLMQNPFATRSVNLQPFSIFTYDGDLRLSPSIDTFQDVTRLPDLVIEDSNLFDAMTNLTEALTEAGVGTTWSTSTSSNTTSSSSSTTDVRGDAAAINAAIAALESSGVTITEGRNAGQVVRQENRGFTPPLRVTESSSSGTTTTTTTSTRIGVSGSSIQRTSYGERVVDVQLAQTMRSIGIRVESSRLKPNTRYYFFFDEIDCTDWFSVDTIQNNFPDGVGRYSGRPGTTQQGFGIPIISDDVGYLQGVFLIPNGRPPVVGTLLNTLDTVQYQTTGETRSFNTGTRKVKITSSEVNANDLDLVEGYAETSFVSSGVLLDKQETIVSTRVPEVGTITNSSSSTSNFSTSSTTAEYFDPVAQSFLIDSNSPEGVFVTELDVFFKTKDLVEGVEAYITSTDGEVPTLKILPFSRVVKNSDTILRVICTLTNGVPVSTIDAGATITGKTSGLSGTVKSVINFESAANNATTNVTNTVYNVVLNNYGSVISAGQSEFIPGEELLIASVSRGSTRSRPAPSRATYTIVSDTYEVESVRLTALGQNYHNPTVTFSAPQLPGGVTATGTVKVGPNSITEAGDIIYEVTVTNKGSGYTEIPSVTFADVIPSTLPENTNAGSGAAAGVLVSDGTVAVDMGVSTSADATAATKFKFEAPVYLLGNTNYAFVLKAPTSLNYNVYTSKLGEMQLGTETRVSQQPLLGSLFKSQNGGLWTEDQTQDIKFVLHRANFQTAAAAEVRLVNAPLTLKKLPLNPIETNSNGSNPSSNLFGSNPQVIRVVSFYHGLLPGDLVAISGIEGAPGGIPDVEINTVHTVIDANLEYFTVKVPTVATNNERDGGASGYITPNRPYEVLDVTTGAMVFGSSQLIATNRATQSAGVTGYNTLNAYKLDTPNNIRLADSYYYNGAKLVANEMNEAKFRGANQLRGNPSLETTVTLSTLSSKVSPVLDFERTNATVVRSLVDNPLAAASVQGTREATLTLNTRSSGLTLPVSTALAYTKDSVNYTASVKSYNSITGKIVVNGDNVDKLIGATFANSTINSIGVAVVISNGILFIPETSPDGSVYAKWISRQFLLENPCDGIEMKLAVCQYENTSVRAYYRPRDIGFEGDITQENWTPFNADQTLNSTNDSGQIISTIYPGLPDDVNNIRVRSSANVDPRDIFPDEWTSLTFSVQDMPAFDSVQVKIVMTSSNPALTPLIDDMQLVCSE